MNNKNLIYILSIVCIITIILPFLFTRSAFCDSLIFSGTGQIGDTIGGITAPVIGLLNAFLLYLTIKEQYAFNKEQHIFNEKQKKDSFDTQFKDTFFALLQNQLELIDKINSRFCLFESGQISEKQISRYSFFSEAILSLKYIHKSFLKDKYVGYYSCEYINFYLEEIARNIDIEEIIDDNYRVKFINSTYDISEEFFNKYQSMNEKEKIAFIYLLFFNKHNEIGIYFRHLYNILKYIDSSEKEAIDKFAHTPEEEQEIKNQYKQYAQFIQAQMSSDELCLLFYNSFLFEKMQKLIIKYNLLENLTIESLITKEHNCIEGFNLKSKSGLFKEFTNKRTVKES